MFAIAQSGNQTIPAIGMNSTGLRKVLNYDFMKKKKSKKARTGRRLRQISSLNGYTLSESCTLKIKFFENITIETPEMLVCDITDVGLLMTSLICIKHFSITKVDKTNIDHPRALKVAFVDLGQWNPHVSETNLSKAVYELLSQCRKLEKTSIYFPRMGHSKTFHFSNVNVAEILLSSIKSYIDQNKEESFPKSVSMLAPSRKFFSAMNNAAKERFLSNSNAGIPAHASVTDAAHNCDDIFDGGKVERGTVYFLLCATQCNQWLPSYWNSEQKNEQLVEVDTKTYSAIENLVKSEWERRFVGLGKDAKNIPKYSKVEVSNIQRIENRVLFQIYNNKRAMMCKKAAYRDSVCPSIDELRKSDGPVDTQTDLPDFMTRELIHEVNECYLFHGTKTKNVEKIARVGLNPGLGSSDGMFGRGVYFAESPTKADQYADTKNKRSVNEDLTMLLSRVLLGNVYLCTEKHPSITGEQEKLRRPPCMECSKPKCSCTSGNFDSVMGDGKWIFREFVVYEKDDSYPEYVITYKRVPT